jgi:hypothetical protein
MDKADATSRASPRTFRATRDLRRLLPHLPPLQPEPLQLLEGKSPSICLNKRQQHKQAAVVLVEGLHALLVVPVPVLVQLLGWLLDLLAVLPLAISTSCETMHNSSS